MANVVQQLGDTTSKDVKPDFDGAKGYFWMKQAHAAGRASANGERVHLPRKERSGLAEQTFFEQVDRRLSRQSFCLGATFDKDGNIVRN